MPLDQNNLGILAAELKDPLYNGLTSQQAYDKLYTVVTNTVKVPNGFLLTPVSTAKIIGIDKTEAIAGIVKQKYPNTADHLLNNGLDANAGETQGFLKAIVGSVITQQDLDAINAASTKDQITITNPISQDRFDGLKMPRLRALAGLTLDRQPGESAFPNFIVKADFDPAWTLAGRN